MAEWLEDRSLLAVFIVNTPSDVAAPGLLTLREAIDQSNSNLVPDEIRFDLPDPTVPIRPLTALPEIRDEGLHILGETQPGYTGAPLIEIDGSLTAGANGLVSIGGDTVFSALVVNNFDAAGLAIGRDNSQVLGCYVGTDRTGTLDQGNGGPGVLLFSAPDIFARFSLVADCLISGNDGDGIQINNSGSNSVSNCFIGTDVTGSQRLGNSGSGVFILDGTNNTIGEEPHPDGSSSTSGNRIWFNSGNGVTVAVSGVSAFANGNAIFSNSITQNEGLGIDLGDDGPTGDDPGDLDDGPNNFQNAPVITSATVVGSNLQVDGTIDGPPPGSEFLSYLIQLFQDSGDPTGFGQGVLLLTTVDVIPDSSGTGTFSVNIPLSSLDATLPVISGTATALSNDTSEFSLDVAIAVDLSVTKEPATSTVLLDDSLVFTMVVTNSGPINATLARLVDTLPAGLTYVSSTTTQGTIIQSGSTVDVDLGTLTVGASATVTVTVTSTLPGTQINVVDVSSAEPEIDPANNRATAVVTVDPFDFVVRNTNDDGRNSLRRAIVSANRRAGADRIVFDIPGAGPHIILLLSALPASIEQVEIDARTQPTGRVAIDGKSASAADGLVLSAANSSLFGLGIQNFIGSGLILSGPSGMRAEGNWIGTDVTGMTDQGNQLSGILIANSSGATVTGNVISGNGLHGVFAFGPGSTLDSITNNLIGVSADQSLPIGNGGAGILIQDGASQALISGNVVGANDVGVALFPQFDSVGDPVPGSGGQNTVNGNAIGVSTAGTGGFFPNTVAGVYVFATADNVVGQDAAGSRNTIYGGSSYGVWIVGSDASGNTVEANQISIDDGGTPSFSAGIALDGGSHGNTVRSNLVTGHGDAGILMTSDAFSNLAERNTVGDSSAADLEFVVGIWLTSGATGNTLWANQVSNNNDGVAIDGGATGTTVSGNVLGLAVVDSSRRGNAGAGIRIDSSANVIGIPIGSTDTADRNIISGNMVGVLIHESDSTDNIIRGNYIGTDSTGNVALPNSSNGVVISDSPENTLDWNLISGNGGVGVHILGSNASLNVLTANYIGTNAVGSAAVPNIGDGVLIVNAPNTHVGDVTFAGNLISGNRGSGVHLQGSGTRLTSLRYNLIGTDAGQAFAVPNAGEGVFIDNAPNNFIAGDFFPVGNVIAGNAIGIRILGPEAAGNVVDGSNFIGTNGVVAIPNTGDGILIENANGNTIGSPSRAGGNFISGNLGAGVHILGAGAAGNIVSINHIGTNAAGLAAIPNGGAGVLIERAPNNTIGGLGLLNRNLISGNLVGIYLVGPGATGNTIASNLVGTTFDRTAAIPNIVAGILLDDADGNTIGGSSKDTGNQISGNLGIGLLLSGSSSNLIARNRIGTNGDGSAALANAGDGILLVNSGNNTVGGPGDGPGDSEGNLISGNLGTGLHLNGVSASSNLVLGNRIGTNAYGTAALPNGAAGVLLENAPGNIIGGAYDSVRNLISGNALGLYVFGPGATANKIVGNRIGTNIDGNAAIPNTGDGIFLVNAPSNTIGGLLDGDGNLISGNLLVGIHIAGAGATGNLMIGNRIGTNASGTGALPNADEGVNIEGASGNVIGGSTASTRNIISGNAIGVRLAGTGATGNRILGNRIGTNADGTAALPNSSDGIFLENAPGNTVGGAAAGEGNLLSGNLSVGLQVEGFASANNLVFGNRIGTNATGDSAIANLRDGVFINGAPNNSIGGANAGEGNLISGNTLVGIQITGDIATGNRIIGNLIGTDAAGSSAIPNANSGILVENAPSNTIGGPGAAGNVVVGSSSAGIYLFGGVATGNIVAGNKVGTNASGTAALPNGNGILIDSAPGNQIGTAAAGNLVSGNLLGLRIAGATASGNVALGNIIGLALDGVTRLGNRDGGIFISDAPNNRIGGAGAGEGNTISSNGNDGVQIFNPSASGNVLQGNRIGTDVTGTIPVGNLDGGVFINDAPNNTVGGLGAGEGNIIAGNGGFGVLVLGPRATGNVVVGNLGLGGRTELLRQMTRRIRLR